MTQAPDEPGDADPTQLEQAGAAIDDAKAAAARTASHETIDTGGDLPTAGENVPAAPAEGSTSSGSDEDVDQDPDSDA